MKSHLVNSFNQQSGWMQPCQVASKSAGVITVSRRSNSSLNNITLTRKSIKEGMKLKTLLATLLGTFLLQHMAFCQTNVVSPDQPVVTAVTNQVAADAVTNQPEAVVASEAPVEAAAATNAVALETAAGTNAPAPEAVVIPLIQLQEVPITTAIENLARQANINYLLDPKIGYGQPDANGQIKAEPNLSIRWENITAAHALTALL